jgi:hypothetical protein
MIKLQAPNDHNWTHQRYPRTLYEAFKGQGDMYISEPTKYDPEDMFVMQWCAIGFIALAVILVFAK